MIRGFIGLNPAHDDLMEDIMSKAILTPLLIIHEELAVTNSEKVGPDTESWKTGLPSRCCMPKILLKTGITPTPNIISHAAADFPT